jgi:hypothetical protein
MSYTFTLKGYGNVLSANYSPPINLDARFEYSIGLVSLSTYNSIPNIQSGNDVFYYGDKSVKIPTGAYEISDIEKYLQNALADPADNKNRRNEIISLHANNNTLKTSISSVYRINFEHKDSIGRMLGFSKRILEPNIIHESDLPVNIIKVSSCRLECNIVWGTFYDDTCSHTLYEFHPAVVNPGYSIIIEPTNIIYLPINVSSINNITITLLDQDGEPVNFRQEKIVVKLELKKNGVNI